MESTVLYWPMFTQIGLSLLILFWLAYSRVSRIARHGLAEIRKTGFPAHVNNASDNFKNQFEIPVLFYAICLFFILSGEVTPLVLGLAWVFAIGCLSLRCCNWRHCETRWTHFSCDRGPHGRYGAAHSSVTSTARLG